MIDESFHKKSAEYSLQQLAELTGCTIFDPTHKALIIKNVAPIDTASEGDITFLQNVKYTQTLEYTKATAIIISEKYVAHLPRNIAALITDNPYAAYAKIAQKFYPEQKSAQLISERAYISPSAQIGAGTVIMANATIGDNVIIGENCTIHPNVAISHAVIGNNCIIHHGAAIGQDGFGFAFDIAAFVKVPQLGRVIIENDVEIGANTTIDRGAAPDTIIGQGTKLDNLIQIGHNVKIGKHCVIAAHTGISGSTEIGNYCMIGGQVGIAGHLKIGNKVQIAAQSGIMRNVEDGEALGGSPAVPMKQFLRQAAMLAKLAKK